MLRALCFAGGCLVFVAGCGRPASPPIAPVEPVPARGPGPAPSPAAEAEPPPKEAPSNPAPDAPRSPAAVAPSAEGKDPGLANPPKTARTIRPHQGASGCVEMYGTCTPPPERLCTTTALHVDCGQRGQVPSSGEWVECLCAK